ncbi:MAG: outer membrane beta-barrel family protein [Muribaculaceae bacterium]|nr:outer membrane beta-barrel family protein [Muribaculaceae bacterium]
MNTICRLLSGVALLPASLFAQEAADSIADLWEKELALNEVVVVSRRPVVKQQEGRLVYLVRNDPYAKGLDGMGLLDRIPRVSVTDGNVSVAGKGTVRYIIDGILMELDPSAMSMRLKNIQAENIEKIELLTTPPSRYAAEPNAVYISITTRNESLGTRGSVFGSLNQRDRLREYFSGSVSHTTRRLEMSLDASVSNYYSRNDNDIEYQFADHSRMSATRTESSLFNAGINALLKYKLSSAMNLGLIANYGYESATSNGLNTSSYGDYASTSESHTASRPNNALTVTGFYDWTFGKNGEMMELTYNNYRRHSPADSKVATSYSNDLGNYAVDESGASDYRFHSGKIDFKLPYTWAQLEAGIAYTDILNSSDNYMECAGSHGDAVSCESDRFDYKERIAGAYITASRSLGGGFWGKAGLRYEYTWTEGKQLADLQVSKAGYGHLFPTVNLSWNKDHVGSFNISYSMGMGRPNLWELNPYRYYSTSDEYAAGNPYLKPTLYNNAEINYYGLGGLYAVLYTSFASDVIGYMRRFDSGGTVSTVPYNCFSTNKTGLYANYRRDIFDRWEIRLGGEIFRSYTRGKEPDLKFDKMDSWSGKIEVSTNVMLNRQKTLIFNARFTHFFPWQQDMVSYESFQLLNLTLRYALLSGRLNLSLSANDIFGWNKTKSSERYDGYTIRHTFDPHSAYVLVGVSYRFGRDKVRGVWRDSKETQSSRTK